MDAGRSVRRGYPWWVGGIAAILLIGIIGIGVSCDDGPGYLPPRIDSPGPVKTIAPTRVPTPALSKDEQCLRTVGCAAKRDDWLLQAAAHCSARIESRALYAYEWASDGLIDIFDPSMTVHRKGATGILYQGNKAQFLSGLGEWQRVRYECLYNPITEYVLHLEVHAYN